MQNKINELLKRLQEVEDLLGNPHTHQNQKLYRELTQEHAYLNEVGTVQREIEEKKLHLQDNLLLIESETDPEFIKMLKEDSAKLEERAAFLERRLENLLVPPDPNDDRNTILELRAGTGGEEAALFVGDCARMYKLFADQKGWSYEQLSSASSEMGGFKEYVMVISGKGAYRFLKHEAGTHRVQRVPETEAQGRVHTSAITVAVLMEPGEAEEVKIDEKDLRIDTFRSSGAGGQHVNTTDSAVRITHIPTGIVVGCQEERSQHKNRDKAMRVLQAKLSELEREKQEKEMASLRSEQVGTGDRSERIRTYNFPQNRVTDHRINLTLHKLDAVMQGDLEDLTSTLVKHYHQQKLMS